MRTKTVMIIVALFVMQSYALNIPTSPELSELVEDETFEVGARSSNGMLAIPDNNQQSILDNQSDSGANDNDGDGMVDSVDPDDDNDCIPDSWDAIPTDFDGDGINDHEDNDDDGDGLNDSEEVSDNNGMTNIYDADNDGYHDCSSFGMLLFNMLDVEVELGPPMNGGTVAPWDALFTINASSLVIGETYSISWWLLDTDTNSIVNSSTANSFTTTDTNYVMQYPWYDLENSTYYMTAELWFANGSSTYHFHLSSANTAFTVGQSSGNNNGGNSNCPPDALLSNRDFDTGNNQTEFIYGQEDIELYAYHPCLESGVYYWNFSMSGPNGYMSNEWTDGMFYLSQGPTHYDLNTKSYANADLSPGMYSWTYGLSNSSKGISEWFTHNFTVLSEPSNPNCATNTNGQLSDNWNFSEIATTTYFALVITAECLMDNGQSYELVYELWEEGASGSMQDNAGSGQWDSYDETETWSISWFNPVSGIIGEWGGGNYTFKAMLYMPAYSSNGSTLIDELSHDFCVNTATVNCNVQEEEPDNETELTGACSFLTFEATPASLYSGDDLTFAWTMGGDVSTEVYLALVSGWGAQYYFSSIEDNDGFHTITLPDNMNPSADYTIYIESAYNDDRTTLCWKYGSIDILEDNEGVVLDDIIDLFLNTTDERPRISMWYGKVNQHNEEGTWMTDPDGTAGAGLYAQWGSDGWGDRKLEYCQRFWPDTVETRTSAPEEIVFYTRGNTHAYLTMKPVWLCIQDTDGDGILDPEDDDDDNDGWADVIEEVCFSDPLDSSVVPEDLDGDGLCDVLQILLIGDFEPPEPGFCTNGEITGGNGLIGQTEFVEVVAIEMTGGNYQYQYQIQDTANNLHADIVQSPNNYDFRGYYEYYDIFVSNANGDFNPNGSFITIQARSDLSTSNLGVGFNIDSVGLRDINGNVIYATEVVSVVLGDNLGADNPAGRQVNILGPADQIPTAMGNGQASITVSFCPVEELTDDEFTPGFGVVGALVALGAAMLAGRRSFSDEDTDE